MQERSGLREVIEQDVWGIIRDILNFELINVGSEKGPIIFTVGLLLLLIFSLFVASVSLKGLRILITRKMSPEDRLKFISIFGFIRYFVYIIVFLLILSAAGINIIVLLTASAALFVGLGLALREIFQDLIGGISIIIDKSLHVGDIIEVEEKVGRVIEINLRTTRALTRDDKVIVIPNHKFISDVIYNYTQNHKSTREVVHVRVSHGSDTRKVEQILISCAREQKGISKKPDPFVFLEEFAESALILGLYFFIEDSFVEPKITSQLRFKIDGKFRANNISIPFPQRDVHFFPTKSSDGATKE